MGTRTIYIAASSIWAFTGITVPAGGHILITAHGSAFFNVTYGTPPDRRTIVGWGYPEGAYPNGPGTPPIGTPLAFLEQGTYDPTATYSSAFAGPYVGGSGADIFSLAFTGVPVGTTPASDGTYTGPSDRLARDTPVDVGPDLLGNWDHPVDLYLVFNTVADGTAAGGFSVDFEADWLTSEDSGTGGGDLVSSCPPHPVPINFEVQFFSRTTGKRLFFNPDKLTGLRWGYTDQGGMDQLSLSFAKDYDDTTFPASAKDTAKVFRVGESIARWEGMIQQDEDLLDLRETKSLIVYGPLEDMNHVLVNKRILHPGGADLIVFIAELLDDYLAGRPGLIVDRDLQTTGINLEMVTLTDASVRAAIEQVMKASSGNVVWGWEVSPDTGRKRFYVRPRILDILWQKVVGAHVKVFHSPDEHQGVINRAKFKGGPAKFPQLLQNPSFEEPILPSEASGSLLADGGFEQGTGHYESGASRQEQGTNLHSSPHSGQWCLELDHPGEEYWEECAATPLTSTYKAVLYDAREDGAIACAGRLIVEGRTSPGGSVVETYTLPLAPASAAWSGGQNTAVIGGDDVSLSVIFQDPSITTARVRVLADTASLNAGLLIDDLTFAEVGAVGQAAWSTHLQHPGDAGNKFLSIDWNCKASPWEGNSFVRLSVIADAGHRPALAPLGGDNSGVAGAHYQPKPQQALRPGLRVRMAPGLSSDSGLGRVEYREWGGDAHETQASFGPDTVIPNDGQWHFIYHDVTAHGDVASATTQWTFAKSGVYDIDGATTRDQAAGEGTADVSDPLGFGQFLRADTFERYVKAEEVCDPGSEAYNSFTNEGLQEGLVTDPAVLLWNADAEAVLKAFFDQNAIAVQRPKLELTDDPDLPYLTPAAGKRIRVSGTERRIPDSWPARSDFAWTASPAGTLVVTADLNRERPTAAKLLSRGATDIGSGGVSASAAFGGGGSQTTGNGSGITTPTPSAITVGDGETENYPVSELDSPHWDVAYDEDTDTAVVTIPGRGAKDPCRVIALANLTLSGLQTVDGVTLAAGERVLANGQIDKTQNGPYRVVDGGPWTRTWDFDEDDEAISGTLVPIAEGAANADTLWMLTTDAPITLGVTPLAFAPFTGVGAGRARYLPISNGDPYNSGIVFEQGASVLTEY